MRILVVGDDSPDRDRLRRMLVEAEGGHEFAGEAADGWEAVACCRAQPIDLVLMDTQLPGMTGLDAARQLAQLKSPPAVILMTPHAASTDLENHRIACCLSKPVRREPLEDALRHARRLSLPGRSQIQLEAAADAHPGRRREISARYRHVLHRVPLRDVIYLLAEHKYVTVRHVGGELLVEESLSSFEQEFPDLFMRIHRNALVARSQVRGLEKDRRGTTYVTLLGCHEQLVVSRRRLAEIRRWLKASAPKADAEESAQPST